MTHLLIVEANTPDMVTAGQSGAAGFVTTIQTHSPDTAYTIINPHAAAPDTRAFEGADGIIFTGSGVAWATNSPEAAPQRAAMEIALGTSLPVWGSCNGMQLGALILGATLGPSPNGIEIGIARDLQLTNAGQEHPMMAGRENGFGVPCVHRDEIQHLSDCITLIAGNAHTPVQAIACDSGGVDFWGTQYHPELTAGDVADYIRAQGVFAGFPELTGDLDHAESDAEAATRLGTTPAALTSEIRARELINWLAHAKTNPRNA